MGEVNLGQVAALIQSVGIETLPEGAKPTVRNTGTKANADLVFGLPATITTAQVKKLIEGSETGVLALFDECKCRNLLDVFGIRTVHFNEPASKDELKRAMKILHDKINADGNPDFSGLRLGDYLDLPELNDGNATYRWNDDYKNLRIMISAFNLYKNTGSPENTKNHIVFTFRNCVLKHPMNSSSTNLGGYSASKMASYLDGGFKSGLEQFLGHLYPVSRLLSTKGNKDWKTHTVFLLNELEVFGCRKYGDLHLYSGFQEQLPIFKNTEIYGAKKLNGTACSWWLSAPCSGNETFFCYCFNKSPSNGLFANVDLGVSPAFCVA